jgi:hypothetical protein
MRRRVFALAAVLAPCTALGWTLAQARTAGAEPAGADAAYGQTGTAAETAYLNRTAYWVNRFESLLGGGTSLAMGQLSELSVYAS